VIYVGITIFAFYLETGIDFLLLAVMVAMVQGGTQALSRSLFGSMIPKHESGEFFGIYSIFSKFAGIFGPAIFALMLYLTESSRNAILSITLFFIAGGILLLFVNVEEGQRIAQEVDDSIQQPGNE
jgi:UMF1 family MFS transporter